LEPVVPLLQRSRARSTVEVASFLDASATEYIASLVQAGCLVSLFRTSDGGALGAAVTLDGEQEKEYFRAVEEFTEWLREVDQAVAEVPASAPSVKRPRKRP
jgi:hypothetical protein